MIVVITYKNFYRRKTINMSIDLLSVGKSTREIASEIHEKLSEIINNSSDDRIERMDLLEPGNTTINIDSSKIPALTISDIDAIICFMRLRIVQIP